MKAPSITSLKKQIPSSQSVIVLILENPVKDYIHAVRLRSAIAHAKLDMKVWVIQQISTKPNNHNHENHNPN
ncbi:MAG: hypothetical protein P8O22_02820 [Akkermansiaceae bacterium]|nr:hypothetical protein [Akkermansiaceae bacterium]